MNRCCVSVRPGRAPLRELTDARLLDALVERSQDQTGDAKTGW